MRNEYRLRVVEPPFNSQLTQLIIDLEFLRRQEKISGTAPHSVFSQIRDIFFIVESLVSARIEGNHTTILEYIEERSSRERHSNSFSIQEIQNLEKAMRFAEENASLYPLNRSFISELHKLTVEGLPAVDGEGDHTPGVYRKEPVAIQNSQHLPPDPARVGELMEELLEWIASPLEPRYDLLKTALTHHRFVWIHPFTNGNGRTARLLTYAMLVKYGFTVSNGRIVNPASVFSSTRNEYYRLLSEADAGEESALLSWSEYLLRGLKVEIEKIYRLSNYDFLKERILLPALENAERRETITENEKKVLQLAIEKELIKLSDVQTVISKAPLTCTRLINELKNRNMLVSDKPHGRIYRIQILDSPLLRYVIGTLDQNGFLPIRADE